MSKRNRLSTLFVLAGGLLLLGVVANPQVSLAQSRSRTPRANPPQSQCAATTDEQIVAAIHEKIKADERFNDQWKHINVSSRHRIVTFNGWVKGHIQKRDLIRYASRTACVRSVKSAYLIPFRMVRCLAGQKQCGDICIDRTQQCNLIQ